MPGGRFEDLDPVVVEDSRDPPPSYPSSPLPFDAFPPDHGGGAGGGPAPEGPAPASPAQPAPIETAPPAPPAGSPPPPFAGRVISEDSGGGPIQRDNRDHSLPDSGDFIPTGGGAPRAPRGMRAVSPVASMREAGMTNVSNEYQMAWVNGGNLVRDYQATAQRLQSDYNAFL